MAHDGPTLGRRAGCALAIVGGSALAIPAVSSRIQFQMLQVISVGSATGLSVDDWATTSASAYYFTDGELRSEQMRASRVLWGAAETEVAVAPIVSESSGDVVGRLLDWQLPDDAAVGDAAAGAARLLRRHRAVDGAVGRARRAVRAPPQPRRGDGARDVSLYHGSGWGGGGGFHI